ncbi:pleckstrin homology domain-containing family G member 1-like isoform X2 [Adelges cooleyi]|uniref:pleckstrin homology domain-containing family G member 1-like isoform X2 n=1 Tax=Adelges cooleyi TaxID=133065 RepID=UPI00217F2ED5|nr:pleckstrin homology domain-containing family G member 1-like isoform X2 [Adelges cooleyi]
MNMMMTDFRTEMVITEILDTERSYVRHLREVVEDYLGYWKTRNVLSKVQCNQLFGNITEIYKFSKLFLCELESCKPNAREIARCFLNNRLKFIVYSTYCVNFHKSDSILSDLMRNPQTLNTILQRQKDLGHRLPLGSYLVFPIQRMLRYHLLLEIELSNNCFELYAEGDLLIAGTKKKLRVILLNNVLLIAKEQKCGQLEYKDHISSNDMTITENVDGDPLSFCVSSNEDHKHSYKLQARVKKEKIFWVKTLNHMKADTTGFSAMTGLAELIAERFYLPSDLL